MAGCCVSSCLLQATAITMSDVATMVAKNIRMRILLGGRLASSSSARIVNVVNIASGRLGRMSSALGFVGATLLLCACQRVEPPGAEIDASESTSRALPPTVGSSPATVRDAASAPSATPIAPDPASLPQTNARPAASGAVFDAKVRALWSAIVGDDPDKAMAFFFPLAAYRQVKDVADPESDWKRRLVAAYQHDIHALHVRLGEDANRAQLVNLDVPDSRARWIEPGEEWNKIGYFRVFGSRLRFTIEGNERSFDVKSLISWRGDWYVVHLSAIK